VIVVLNKRKPAARKGKIVLLNASKRLKKGKPKNYIPEEAIRPLAAAFLKGETVDGEIAVISRKQAEEADYNLSPGRWVEQVSENTAHDLPFLIKKFIDLSKQERGLDDKLINLLTPLIGDGTDATVS
jgi:type I restriction enzyme M protein